MQLVFMSENHFVTYLIIYLVVCYQAKDAIQAGMKKGSAKDKSALSKVNKGVQESRAEKSTNNLDFAGYGFLYTSEYSIQILIYM